MNPDDTLITSSITPDKPKGVNQPIPGKDFKYFFFKKPESPFVINAVVSKDNKKAQDSEVYKVKIKFAKPTVEKVVFVLKNKYGGIVPEPVVSIFHMSPGVRKPMICICENKDADQLRGDREADQRLCFRYLDSATPLLPKSEILSL